MKRENKTFLLWSIIVMVELIGILVLSKVNITLANMYPEVTSIILGVHGIGIVIGILMCAVGRLFGLLILNLIKRYRLSLKTVAFKEKIQSGEET